MAAADSALVLVDGVAGVEVQTEKVWSFAEEFQLPRAIVINKLDRERSDFDRALASVQEIFGRTAVPIHLPLGAEKDFKGIIDLVRMKAYTYANDGDGKGKEAEIPADRAEAAQKAHEALIEMVAEGNDALMEQYFDKGTLEPEQILSGLRQAIREREFIRCCAPPVCTTSAPMRCSISWSRISRRPPSTRRSRAKLNGKDVERAIKDSEPVSAFVFKTVADPFAGRVTYFKVISGVVKNDCNLVNSRNSTGERLAHHRHPHGQNHPADHRTACRRHRSGGEAQGDPHRRHVVRQGRPLSPFRPCSCPSLPSLLPFRPRAARTKIASATPFSVFWKKINRSAFTAIRKPRNFCWPAAGSSTWR